MFQRGYRRQSKFEFPLPVKHNYVCGQKEKSCTYSQPSASIPSQSLDEAFLTEVIANKVLVSSEKQDRNPFQHTWQHRD